MRRQFDSSIRHTAFSHLSGFSKRHFARNALCPSMFVAIPTKNEKERPMKKSILICSSVFALALTSMSVAAQDKGASGGNSPGASGPSSSGGSAGGGGGSSEHSPSGGGSAGDAGAGPKAGREGSKPGVQGNMKEGNGSKADKSEAQERSSSDRAKTGKNETKDSAKSGDDKTKDSAKSGDDKMKDSAKSDASKDNSAATGKSDGTTGAGSPPKLSGEQRTKVQSSFRGHKDKSVRNLNITVNVGVAVPRSVTLYAVPEDVIVIAPDYRRYKYFVYEERVVIVDPETYEIIEIIILA